MAVSESDVAQRGEHEEERENAWKGEYFRWWSCDGNGDGIHQLGCFMMLGSKYLSNYDVTLSTKYDDITTHYHLWCFKLVLWNCTKVFVIQFIIVSFVAKHLNLLPLKNFNRKKSFFQALELKQMQKMFLLKTMAGPGEVFIYSLCCSFSRFSSWMDVLQHSGLLPSSKLKMFSLLAKIFPRVAFSLQKIYFFSFGNPLTVLELSVWKTFCHSERRTAEMKN